MPKRKKNLVEWTAECQQAFSQMKHLCSQTPILVFQLMLTIRNPLSYTQMVVRMDLEVFFIRDKMMAQTA